MSDLKRDIILAYLTWARTDPKLCRCENHYRVEKFGPNGEWGRMIELPKKQVCLREARWRTYVKLRDQEAARI